MKFFGWVRNVLNRDSPDSFGRTGTAFVVAGIVAWGSWIVYQKTQIPDIPSAWITLVGILWGSSSLKEAYIKVKENVQSQQP